MKNNSTFGQRLAYTRNKKGLSQSQFAKLIGVTQSSLCRWETGRRKPDMSMVQKIIKAMEVSEDWFENDDNFSIKPLIENQQYIKLTKKQQQLVADNENVIGAVFHRFVRRYNPMESYDDFYGDAAINLCRAAKIFDETCDNQGTFFVYAFVFVKWAIFNSYNKAEKYLHRTTSLNKIIGEDDHGNDVELGEQIPTPDEWESLEYKILAESVYQKVENVLTVKEKEVFRPWLHGVASSEIARITGVNESTVSSRMMNVRIKCRTFFKADEIFSYGGQY